MNLPRNRQVVAYDAANKTTSLEYSVPSGTVLFKETYAFDGEGNRTCIADGAGRVASFSYDQLNRLTSETDPVTGEERVYKYDPAGNRTRKTIFASDGTLLSSTSYAYNQANELVSIDRVPATHDANGNLLGLGSLTYVFDAQNRLTAVKNGSETVPSFVYDGQGRRISQTTAAGTTFYHYAGDRVAYETDSTGTITTSFTYSGSGIPVSMTYQGQTYWYLTNYRGDVLKLVDGSGTVAASYRYDAWGNIPKSSGPLAEVNPYRYAGYRYDSATGLYFLKARYYSPELGRFLSRDQVLGAPKQSQTLNLYQYAVNNPLSFVDPSGRWVQAAAAAIGAAVGVVNYVLTTPKEERNVRSYVWAAATGAVAGVAVSYNPSLALQFAKGGALAGAGLYAKDWATGKEPNWSTQKLVGSTVSGAITAAGVGRLLPKK